MPATIWDELGIAATKDERAIKRAYAARLKVASPESDPAGYMKLREAYESAKRYARSEELPPEQENEFEPVTEVQAPVPVPVPARPPQLAALARLHSQLMEERLDDFLREVESIQASRIFSTLDEQMDFVGAVAVMVQDSEIEYPEWCGRLAEILGAREHDNIFPRGTRYWYAYEAMLVSFTAYRHGAMQTHAQSQAELAATPGYLHVFHVLTAPFDSERLNALTRSTAYHRLAEAILERSLSDPTIVIPPENREWWNRTGMAGQHRPTEPLAAATWSPSTAETTNDSFRFPIWPIGFVIFLLLQMVRSCDVTDSRLTGSDRYRHDPLSVMMTTDPELMKRITGCEPQTRAEVLLHIAKTRRSYFARSQTYRAEDDPEVAALLAKCPEVVTPRNGPALPNP